MITIGCLLLLCRRALKPEQLAGYPWNMDRRKTRSEEDWDCRTTTIKKLPLVLCRFYIAQFDYFVEYLTMKRYRKYVADVISSLLDHFITLMRILMRKVSECPISSSIFGGVLYFLVNVLQSTRYSTLRDVIAVQLRSLNSNNALAPVKDVNEPVMLTSHSIKHRQRPIIIFHLLTDLASMRTTKICQANDSRPYIR